MGVKPFVIVLLCAAPLAAMAQRAPGSDTVLKGSTIEVIQSYKPKVKQSPKPEWIPQLPPADTAHPAFNYNVPQQSLSYAYNSLPLRPLALGKNPDPNPFANYVKVGGGNLSTIYLDAGIGGIYGKDYETAIHLHHLSQKGSIKNQQSSISGLEADGTYHNTAGDWHAGLSAERNQYNYYGYDHLFYDYNGDQVKQTYTAIHLGVDMHNRPDSTEPLSYHPAINASLYNARFNTSEVSVGFDAPAEYKVNDNLDLKADLTGMLTSYKADTVTTANNYIQLSPGVGLHGGQFSGHALVGLALGMGNKGYILPDVIGTFSMADEKFIFSLGYQASLRQNSYEQLTTENPYLNSTYYVQQGRRDEVFANVGGSVGNHLSFTGRASWWKFNELPSFLNDTGDQKQFYAWYQDMQAISVKVGLRYHAANTWSVGVSGDFYSFYNIKDQNNSADQFAWHQPATRIRADFMIRPVSKLTLTAYMNMLGGIHARDVMYHAVKLKSFADVGISGEYQIIPRLSAFLDINNLLNTKYERWLGYQAYGLNIYGGIRLKF